MSNLQMAFCQFQSNIITVLSTQSSQPGGLSSANRVATSTNLAVCSSLPTQYVQSSSFNSWNPMRSYQTSATTTASISQGGLLE